MLVSKSLLSGYPSEYSICWFWTIFKKKSNIKQKITKKKINQSKKRETHWSIHCQVKFVKRLSQFHEAPLTCCNLLVRLSKKVKPLMKAVVWCACGTPAWWHFDCVTCASIAKDCTILMFPLRSQLNKGCCSMDGCFVAEYQCFMLSCESMLDSFQTQLHAQKLQVVEHGGGVPHVTLAVLNVDTQ